VKRKILLGDKAPKPDAHYSNGVLVGDLIFVAGQTGVNPKSGKVSSDFSEQTVQALRNIEAVLLAGGSSLVNVVRLGVYLRDVSDFTKMDKVCQRMFPKNPPARTTVEARVADERCLVEIDAVALKSPS
jgi:2-iminobutanoate/2-iminopropanoate deaminase